VVESQTSNLPWLLESFPLLGEKVVARDISTSHLKCGIASCQRTTELFIELGATEPQDVIFAKAAQEKSEALLRETRQHNERIKAFSEQFARLNDLGAEFAGLSAQAAELSAQAAELSAKSEELAFKESQIQARENELQQQATALSARAEQLNALERGITESLCGKVSRKVRALFK